MTERDRPIEQLRSERDRIPGLSDALKEMERPMEQFRAQWFTQGGEAEFGPIDGDNADEVIASILAVVRPALRRAKEAADYWAVRSGARTIGPLSTQG